MGPVLNTYTPDKCCGEWLSKALLEGTLAEGVWRWDCPVCEQEWRAELHQLDPGEGMKHWAPHSAMVIIQPKGGIRMHPWDIGLLGR